MKETSLKKIPGSSDEESEVYDPQISNSNQEQESCCHYRKRIEKLTANSIEGKWTEEENLKYVLFMDYHSKIFVSKEKRKSTRIFKTLSAFLKTRTPRQCRSHFQKIIGKFKTIKKVKQHYQEELGHLDYQKRFDHLVDQLQTETVKSESKEEEKEITSITNVQVQTEPMKISISDLSNQDLGQIMNMFINIRNCQYPFWMPPYMPTNHTTSF